MSRTPPPSPVLQPGSTCWRVAHADNVRVFIDAVDYFKTLRAALLTARHSVLIVGWDFDTRILLDPDDDDSAVPNQVGALLNQLVERQPGVEVHVLRWDLQVLKTPLRGTTPLVVLDWITGDRIHFKLDSHHPLHACHHQKLVVIDDALAFCGGIDITAGRWDTSAHRDIEPRRQGPEGEDNPPWHDATVAVDGAAARALGDLARARWQSATGALPALPPAGLQRWPATLQPDFRNVDVGIARTLPAYADDPGAFEIAALYVAAIASARRNIYIESQYFAAPAIADALAARLHEVDGPDIVIVNPLSAEGWLEAKLMDSARAVLVQRLRSADVHRRLRFLTPVTAGGTDIYVHAKILVIDDRLLRVGSSNINKRSLDTDTECDLVIEPAADDAEARAGITRIRDALLTEHLGLAPRTWASAFKTAGERLAPAIDALRRPAGRTLLPYAPVTLDVVEQALAETQIAEPGPEGFALVLASRLGPRLRRLVPWVALATGLAAAAMAAGRRRPTGP